MSCPANFAPEWTPMPQLSQGGYAIVSGFAYRAIGGLFGFAVKGASISEISSKVAGLGFSQVQVWTSPTDVGFPPDWKPPSINTSDRVVYVQALATTSTTLAASQSTLGQGAEVLAAWVYECQPAGTTPPPAIVNPPASNGASKLAVVATSLIAAAAVGGLVLELWRHYKTSRKVAT